ncbi:MAG: hypothetical protein ACUVXF_08170 [Desulfobaccales bacterium]
MLKKKNKFWGLLGGLVFLLLNYPLLHIVNQDVLIAGIPLLSLYIFTIWLLAIIWLYSLSRRAEGGDRKHGGRP